MHPDNKKILHSWILVIITLNAIQFGGSISVEGELFQIDDNTLLIGSINEEIDPGREMEPESRIQLYKSSKNYEDDDTSKKLFGFSNPEVIRFEIDNNVEKTGGSLKRSIEKGIFSKKDGVALELTMYQEKPQDSKAESSNSDRKCWRVADGWRCLVMMDGTEGKESKQYKYR